MYFKIYKTNYKLDNIIKSLLLPLLLRKLKQSFPCVWMPKYVYGCLYTLNYPYNDYNC